MFTYDCDSFTVGHLKGGFTYVKPFKWLNQRRRECVKGHHATSLWPGLKDKSAKDVEKLQYG